MRSGDPGGKRAKASYLLLFLILSVGKLNGQVGYLGKRNEIAFDGLAAIQEGLYELEYNLAASKHTGISFSFGYYSNSNEFAGSDEVKYQELGPVSNRTQGAVFGFGFSANATRLDMPFPLGYTFSAHVKYGRLKAFDRYEISDSELEFKNSFLSLQGRVSRNYNLTRFLNLDLSVLFGMMVHKVEKEEGLSFGVNVSRDERPTEPLRIYPLQYPIFSEGLNQEGEQRGAIPPRLFMKPSVRIAYMF